MVFLFTLGFLISIIMFAAVPLWKRRQKRKEQLNRIPPAHDGTEQRAKKHSPRQNEHQPRVAAQRNEAKEEVEAVVTLVDTWKAWDQLCKEAEVNWFLAYSSLYARNREELPEVFYYLDVGMFDYELTKLMGHTQRDDFEAPEGFKILVPEDQQEEAQFILKHNDYLYMIRARVFYKDNRPRATATPDEPNETPWQSTDGILYEDILLREFKDIVTPFGGVQTSISTHVDKLIETQGSEAIPTCLDDSIWGEDP